MRRNLLNRCNLVSIKAELLQEGIFFLVHLFARDILVMKKLEIEKTKRTFIISVLKVDYYVVKVIREKSRGEGFLIEQDSIENVSEPNFFFLTF